MNCDVIKDLIPLYIDECCSEESKIIVEEHIKSCDTCKKLLEDMTSPADIVTVSQAPKHFRKINDWKASVLQSILLFLSFALITIGVTLEAKTPAGIGNGFWAINLIVPATGFLLSLTNWYFIRVYATKVCFSTCSLIATLILTVCAYVWSVVHYELHFADLVNGIYGVLLTIVFCTLSKYLASQYAKLLGKE